MGYKYNRSSFRHEGLQGFKQIFGFSRGQNGRRFIHDEDVYFPVQGLENFYFLLLPHGQRPHPGLRIDVKPELFLKRKQLPAGGL